MAVKFTNNAKTTLASGINSSVTTATVTDGSVFPTLAAGEHFYCTFDDGTNNEIVKVTARSGNTLTIIRGVDNTTARSFSSGDAAELRATSALLTDIQENIAAKSANQTVYNTTTASSATDYDIGIDPSVEANAMVFLNGVMQHHDTFSFSGSTLTFDTAPPDSMALEVIVDNLINLQSSNLTVDTFTAADVGGNAQTDFTLSDAPAAEDNLLVFIDGVFQDQDAYTISNQTLTITDGVTADFGVTVYVINPVNIGTPSDNTVTSSKLSGNITMPADLTVTGDVAFDSPTFVVDNANSRVGLGTASPSVPVDIVGDVKMSANLTVDTDTLHVDSTNNRVGIGTTGPDARLHLSGGSAEKIIIEDSSNPRGNYIGIDGSDNLVIAADEDNLGSSSNIQFRVDASEKMKLDNTGRLLIGQDSGDAFNADAMLRLQRAGDRVFMQFKTDADQNSAILFGDVDDDVECAIEYEPVNQALTFSTGNNTEALRIDSSGNLIMTAGGTIRAGGANDLILDAGESGTPDIYLQSGGATKVKIEGSNGNVGIGAKLYSNSPVSTLGGFQFYRDHTNGNCFVFDTTTAPFAGDLIFGTTNTERMRISSSGCVGVGSTVDRSLGTNIGTLVVNGSAGGGLWLSPGDSSAMTSKIYAQSNGSVGELIINNGTGVGSGGIIIQTNSTERMRIDSSGNLMVGTTNTNPAENNVTGASILGGGDGRLLLCVDSNEVAQFNRKTNDGTILVFRQNAVARGSVSISGANTSYNTTSDARLKDITGEARGLEVINELNPVAYNWKEDGKADEGLIAQEVLDIVPNAVSQNEQDDYYQMDYSKLVTPLVKAIQEQQTQIETLKQEIREIREGG